MILQYDDVTWKPSNTDKDVLALSTPEKFKLPVEALGFLLKTKWKKAS